VVKEARVIGLPVITTRCGGQVGYVADGQNGFLVDPGNVPQLADRLAHILADLDTAKKMGGHEQASQRAWFRPENTANGFLQLYREMVRP
jgi:glycosyltransferase involved in cell wall biosynthesis